MSRFRSADPRQVVIAALERGDAVWEHDEGIDELEIRLPGSEGREGQAVLVGGELYVRVDVDSGRPLSITIPAATAWLQRQVERVQQQQQDVLDRRKPRVFVSYAHAPQRLEPPDWYIREVHQPGFPHWTAQEVATAFHALTRTVRYSTELPAGAGR